MTQEKLLLKKTLFDELKSTTNEIQICESLMNIYPEQEEKLLTKISCLNQHKEFVQKCIQICVVRNKF